MSIVGYTHYGLHQRATRRADLDPLAGDGYDERSVFYYDERWRLLDERVEHDWSPSFSQDWSTFDSDVCTEHRQWVWGLRYIDELAFFQVDQTPDGNFADGYGFFPLLDRRFDVIGSVIDDPSTGILPFESFRYSAYGEIGTASFGDVNFL